MLAAGIHRVKGAKRLGLKTGNWLTAEQFKKLLQCVLVVPFRRHLFAKRDIAQMDGQRSLSRILQFDGVGALSECRSISPSSPLT